MVAITLIAGRMRMTSSDRCSSTKASSCAEMWECGSCKEKSFGCRTGLRVVFMSDDCSYFEFDTEFHMAGQNETFVIFLFVSIQFRGAFSFILKCDPTKRFERTEFEM